MGLSVSVLGIEEMGSMSQKNVLTAESYYKAVAEKNIAALEKYLDRDVEFVGPLAKTTGRGNVLETTKKFASQFKTLKIRSALGSENQAMVVYDVEFPPPIGFVSSAALMTFREGLVVKIELFYDARPFQPKK